MTGRENAMAIGIGSRMPLAGLPHSRLLRRRKRTSVELLAIPANGRVNPYSETLLKGTHQAVRAPG